MEIGKIIEKRRKELGFSLEEVGNAVGVGKSTVKKWESGAIANMRRDKIALLAEKLDLDPSLFISDRNTISFDTKEFSNALFSGIKSPGIDNKKSPSNDGLSENEKVMLQMFRTVPEDRQDELLSLIESALKMNGLLQ